MAELLDRVSGETAADFSCSVDVARYFADALQDEIDSREPRLPLTQLAVDLWRNHREELPELVATLDALFAERLRHDAALVQLSNRFIALGQDERSHADLSPVEDIEATVRNVLLDSAARAAAADADDEGGTGSAPPERGSLH